MVPRRWRFNMRRLALFLGLFITCLFTAGLSGCNIGDGKAARTSIADADGDGVKMDIDNCPAIANPDQLDTDNDTLGDACDDDDDNDGISDSLDLDSLNPNICQDSDSDSCDDCSIGFDGFGDQYESSVEAQTDRYRFNISKKVDGQTVEADSLAYKPEFVYVGEIDLDESTNCRHIDSSDRCDNGNWNTGTLMAQTDGRIYLLLTGAVNHINLLEVRINRIQSSVSMNQPWDQVHLELPFTLDLERNLTLKAGAGGHITRNGKLHIFTTGLGDGIENSYVKWARWETLKND
jgi:hypothetical protein